MAADRMEFSGLALHLGGPTRTGLVEVDWSRRGTLGSHEVLLMANGVGWTRASEAVDFAVPVFHPEAVVSTGFCGALDERLRIADVVLATAILGTFECSMTCEGSPGAKGLICSIDHVAASASEKEQLRASGAIAVEMEAQGVGRRAQALGIPFYCVKAVTDLAGETMAYDFNAALRTDGHFDTMLILKGALRHPIERIPELVRLRNRCVRAARALGDFFADCRF